MATGKRYYWIKLRESFMTSDTVDFLMSQKDGANYVVLYQMLCLKTINTGGRLSRTIGEIVIPYDVEKIQRDCKWFSADTIRVALNLYKRFGLIYEERDGTLVLADHDSMVGSESDWANQKRSQRNTPPELTGCGQCPPLCPPNVHENVHTDIRDKENRDKSLDIRDQIPEIEGEDVCAEPPDSGRSTPAAKPQPTPSEFNIPLNDDSFYNVPQENITEYKRLYPAVDVEQEIRNMIGWCIGNPRNRKTRGGVKRFISLWLQREQDSAKPVRSQQNRNRQDMTQPDPRIAALEDLKRKFAEEESQS